MSQTLRSTAPNEAVLVAVGDVLTTRTLAPMLDTGGADSHSVLPILKNADITLANLEVCLTRRGYPAEKLVTLRADPDVARELRDAGIDIVSLANNHMLDFGYEGLTDTLDALNSVGVHHVGGGEDLVSAMRETVLSRKNCKIAFLSFSACLPLGSEAGPDRPGIAPIRVTTSYEIDPATLQEQPGTVQVVRTAVNPSDLTATVHAIKRAKSAADFLVVAVHWGVAYQDNLAQYQRELAHAMVDSGADLIIGHHPHVPHAVEMYKCKAILYSLGNFVTQYQSSPALSELLQSIGIDMKAEKEKGAETFIVKAIFSAGDSVRVQLIPILIDGRGIPRLVDNSNATRLIRKLATLSTGLAKIDFSDGLGLVMDRE